MLTLYICDSCHYLFSPPDREESRVERCPSCGKESVVVQAQVGGTIVSLVRPAVRPVSEDERADYLNVKAKLEATAEKESAYRKLQERVKTYNMTMGEHNFALILIYYLRDSTPESKRLMLDRFLRPEHWHDQNPDEYVERDYKDIRRKFWSKVNQERHAERDESASPGSALECLNAFRQPYEGELWSLLRPATLGDVRRIDLHQLAAQPGKGYLQFLADWYNCPE